MRHTILIATATLTAAGAFVLFGGVLRESPSAGASALPAERVAAAFDPAFSSAQNAGSLVLRLQQQIRQSPDDAASHALLGLAYQQRARETGDTAYYTRAESVLRRARRARRRELRHVLGPRLARTHAAPVREALVLARRARELAPMEARTLAAVGDALVELGRYREAFATFDRFAGLKPGLAAYARVSYARELLGDRPGAVAAMRLAAETAVPGSEAAAWTALHLGKLFFSGGDHRSAERQFRVALAHVPGYAAAFDGLALVEAARKRLSRAISLERRAVAAVPLPQYVATLGDLLQRAGRPRAAARQYSVVDAIDRVQRASGVNTDLELALFRIDHRRGLAAATSQALAAYRARPSIDAADVAAWGARPHGPVRRGQALLEARAPPGDAGFAEALPPRHDRALPRQLRRGQALAAPRSRAQPRVLSTVVAGSGEARTMKRFPLLAAVLAALALPAIASAHPLGNFTINHSSTLVVSGDLAYVHYVLDMAEIPTLQGGRIDVASLGRKLELTVDGKRVTLRPIRQRLEKPEGAGGLPTTRLELVLAGPRLRDASSLELRDETYAGRLGWKEVIVSASAGARIASSSAPAVSPSQQLRAYPEDGLSSPPTVTQARANVEPGDATGTPPQLTAPQAEEHGSGFESLVTRDLGATGILLALALAALLGRRPRARPRARQVDRRRYLIGQRGTVRHAAYLGGIVTVTHTAGVFALGA